MSDPFMTVPEAIAWIATRDEAFAANRRETGTTALSLWLVKSSLEEAAPSKADCVAVRDAAEHSLVIACRRGQVNALGFRGGPRATFDSERKPITPEDWIDLVFGEEGDQIVAQPDTSPARPTYSRDYWREIRFRRDEVFRIFPSHEAERAPAASEGTNPEEPPRRKRRGPPSFAELDTPLVVEMKKLISTKQVRSILAAATMLAPKAAGGGTVESRIDRLRRAYSKTFPNE